MGSLGSLMFHFLINGEIILCASSVRGEGAFTLTGEREGVCVLTLESCKLISSFNSEVWHLPVQLCF